MLFLYNFPPILFQPLPFTSMTFQLYCYSKDPVMNSIFILMLDSQAGQVEGLFSLTRMPFFHD